MFLPFVPGVVLAMDYLRGNVTEPPCRLCAVWSSLPWFLALHQSSAISEHLYLELVHFINLLVLPQWMKKKSICLRCFCLVLLTV